MRNATEKWAPIACAVFMILLLSAYLAVFLFAMLTESMSGFAVAILMAVYCLLILAVILGVIAALRQRLREIDNAELEKAKQY